MYTLEKGDYGPRLSVNGPWLESIRDVIKEKKVVELVLRAQSGWKGIDVDFLSEFDSLVAITLQDYSIKNISGIYKLHALKYLNVQVASRGVFDMNKFQDLEWCSLVDIKSVIGFKSLKKLKLLSLYGVKDVSLQEIGELKSLESLSLIKCNFETLKGLGNLGHLKSLTLAYNSKLNDMRDIGKLTELESLDIEACKKIGSVNELATLVNLRKLYLNNCGSIESLKPLMNLAKLEDFRFWESTNIVDGDLSFVFDHPRLDPKKVAFQPRNHYSHAKNPGGKKFTPEDIRRLFP